MTDGLLEPGGWAADALGWLSGVSGEVVAAPWAASAVLLAVGVVTLVAGARTRRPVAALGGALVALAAVLVFAGPLEARSGLATRTLGGAALLAGLALGGAFPPLFPAGAGALPGALAAAALAPADQRALALGVGAAVGAVAGVLLARLVAAVVASALGAVVLSLGVAGALAHAGAGRVLSTHPVALLAVAAILAVAGVALQLPRAWTAAMPAARKPAAAPEGDATGADA